jgi:tetratricopeptide (TPR) repeat protein
MNQERLDDLWDFADPAASERRLREESAASTGADRAVLLTQVARALGLQGRYEDAAGLLEDIEAALTLPDFTQDERTELRVRTALERGRVLNSAGKPAPAVVQFARAAGLAAGARLDFLAADALHMLAIADPARAGNWTRRGLATALAAPDPRTQRWAVALHGNLGWTLHDAGDHDGALLAFREALREARRVGTADQVRWCEEGLAAAEEALRAQADG